MYLKLYNSKAKCIQEKDFEELVASITSANLDESCNIETIKAFTIITRTELARKLNIYGGTGCPKHKGSDLCDEPGHCVMFSLEEGSVEDIYRRAACSTNGTIITFDGKPIKPYFHYRCGGGTENSENVLGSKITYLRRVLCSYCRGIPDENTEKQYSVEELEQVLNTRIMKPDNVYNSIIGMFEDFDVDDEGRVKSLKIGHKLFKGNELMELLQLNSTRFNYTPVKFLFKSVGMGHGLGLCLCGANEMARIGRSAEEILNYYYTGIKLEAMEVLEEGKPLKGHKFVLDAGCGDEDGKAHQINGLNEKDVNFDIVVSLSRLLRNDGATVRLTREGNENVALSDRAAISNAEKPEIFISILQNCFASAGVSGTEIYHFRGDKESEKLSKLIIDEVCAAIGSKNRGVRTAEFYLLRQVKASAIILHLLYITNPSDAEKLADSLMRLKVAEAIHQAILKYFCPMGLL
ncbi:MAG: stage sporulation protein [Clostridia bacterium]|jgi:SpoIID/LytB domain protein|nr:stage sporulation protein [Clostridia bacterium]